MYTCIFCISNSVFICNSTHAPFYETIVGEQISLALRAISIRVVQQHSLPHFPLPPTARPVNRFPSGTVFFPIFRIPVSFQTNRYNTKHSLAKIHFPVPHYFAKYTFNGKTVKLRRATTRTSRTTRELLIFSLPVINMYRLKSKHTST